MRKEFVAAIITAALFAGGDLARADGTSTAPDSQPATQPAHDAAFIEELVRQLQLAADAERALKATTAADRPALAKVAEATADPEIKKLLLARIEEIDEDILLNPAPISIDLDDASLQDVADAFQKQLGVPIDTWPGRNNGGGGFFPGRQSVRYSLSVKNRPFWEIFAELNEQHPFMVNNYNGMRLQEGGEALHRFTAAPHGCAVFPIALTRTKATNPQAGPNQDQQEQLNFSYTIAVDPRLKIIRYSPPVLTEAKDDLGNSLLPNSDQPQQNMWDAKFPRGMCLFPQNVGLVLPNKPGTKIVSVKGEGHFLVELAHHSVEVDPKDHLNTPIKIDDLSARITEFRIDGNLVHFNLSGTGGGWANGIQQPVLRVDFVDAAGQDFWSAQLNGGVAGTAGGNFQAPVKVRFSIVSKTSTLVVPFEMKDLPLP